MAEEVEQVIDEEVEQQEEEETSEGADKAVEDGDELSADERKEVTNLYKLLKDPTTQRTVIEALAKKAGLLNAETPKEVKENKRELKSIVQDALGPQYAFMHERLTKVFEDVLGEERAQRASETASLFEKQTQQEVDNGLTRLARETNGNSRKLEGKMIALMDQLHAGPNVSTFDYLKLLYNTANADKSAAGARQQIADKINRNAKDVPGRLQSTSTTGKGQPPAGPDKRGIKAAVEFAYERLKEKD